jgi:hypothetical protein
VQDSRVEDQKEPRKDPREKPHIKKRERRSYIVLVLISVILSLLSILYSVRLVNGSNHQWCDIINTIIVVPVQKPADPKAHPSRQRAWEYYQKFVALDKSLGCR